MFYAWNHTHASSMLGDQPVRVLPRISQTSLVRGEGGDIYLRYVNTNVVTFHPDNTFTLNTDGYLTKTTKKRLNEFGPAKVIQRKDDWYIVTHDGQHEFFDGIRVDSFGDPIDSEDYELNPTEETVDNQIRKMYL